MPGVRRRLRDVQKKVSGVLAGSRDDVAPAPPGEQAPEEQEEPVVTSTTELPPVADDAAPDAATTGPDDGGTTGPDDGGTTGPAGGGTGRPDGGATGPDDGGTTGPAGGGTGRPDGGATEGPGSTLQDASLDEVCAGAVELARGAAVEVAGPAVGEHLGAEADGARVVTHSFATSETGYVGWRWAVTVARAQDGDTVTVDEVVLLPGSGALLAPAWVPWSERVHPGDLTPGDLLPPVQDDPRLVPSYADVDAEELPFALHRELGLDRPRVLSLDGRLDAAERWYDGDAGPDSPMAKAAPGRCGGCGFLVPLAGALGRVFGACANAMAPDDGRVVALTHGCGAHSETVLEVPMSSYAGMAVEDDEFLVVDRTRPEIAGEEVVPGSDAVGIELAGDEADGIVEADGEQVVELDGLLVPAAAAGDDPTGDDAAAGVDAAGGDAVPGEDA